MKTVYRIFFVTQCISDRYFVLFYVCDLHYFDVVLCPPRATGYDTKNEGVPTIIVNDTKNYFFKLQSASC